MNIDYLSEARYSDSIDFCIKYRDGVDDSFLYDEALKNFYPNKDNPTYIVINDQLWRNLAFEKRVEQMLISACPKSNYTTVELIRSA